MPRGVIKPSVEVGRLLRRSRNEMGLTLQQVADRTSRGGERIPASTLARIEQGKLDPGVRRLHHLLRLYKVRPHLVADLIELEDLAISPPEGKTIEALYKEGIQYWEQGDTGRGLAHLFAVRQRVPAGPEARLTRQKATLAFAVFARNLGKMELAHQLVDDLLKEPPDPTILVNVLVLAAGVWRGLGSLDAALAFQAQAEEHVRPGDARQTAWLSQQKGRLLVAAGKPEEAQQALKKAIAAYRRIGDVYGETKALLARVDVLAALGRHREAIASARSILAASDAHGHAVLAHSAAVKVGAALAAAGKVEEGIEALGDALARAITLKSHHGQFLAHYHLWKAHELAGDAERARIELESAQYFVRFTDEASAEADEVRRLAETGGTHADVETKTGGRR